LKGPNWHPDRCAIGAPAPQGAARADRYEHVPTLAAAYLPTSRDPSPAALAAMLFALIPIIWLAVVTLVVTLCAMAARGDAALEAQRAPRGRSSRHWTTRPAAEEQIRRVPAGV
jgi:hypothetical protein